MTEEELKRMFANPFYCLRQIHPTFTQDHEPMVSEEEFIKIAVLSIKENGAESYVRDLLENLKGNYV